jgi:hypothetical protein
VTEDLSEEDQQLKADLEMLVERIKVCQGVTVIVNDEGFKVVTDRFPCRKTKPTSTNQVSTQSRNLSEPPPLP